jgi:hypothetical protein
VPDYESRSISIGSRAIGTIGRTVPGIED